MGQGAPLPGSSPRWIKNGRMAKPGFVSALTSDIQRGVNPNVKTTNEKPHIDQVLSIFFIFLTF
jgi:hypothetical protein